MIFVVINQSATIKTPDESMLDVSCTRRIRDFIEAGILVPA